jgi:hypothetical protein|tara:strand:+ start:586 stop:885 length:300 start_codon:yes stop_codon:yes gene_type:complete
MSKPVHRERDSRICGASTVTRINNVRVNNRFISVEGDTNTHGGGSLKATLTVGKVRAGNIPVILTGDPASPDGLCPIPPHCGPNASSASPNVRAGNGKG